MSENMVFLKKIVLGIVVALSSVACALLVGCGGEGAEPPAQLERPGSGAIAATVNGDPIYEDEVSRSISYIREKMGLGSDQEWSAWLAESGAAPEDIRRQMIYSYAEEILVRQGAAEAGIGVDAADLDARVDDAKARYGSDAGWQAALEAEGMTELDFRYSLETQMLADALYASFAFDGEVGDRELLACAQLYLPEYDGAKRSSHILFAEEDKDLALDVLGRLKSGELDFAEAAKEYSADGTAERGGNVGWDVMVTFVEEYQVALDGLDRGEISDLVLSAYGIHIILCTDVYEAPEEISTLEGVPAEFLEAFEATLVEQIQQQAYGDWYTEFYDSAEIVVNDIPEGLPYDIALAPSEGEGAADVDLEEKGESSSSEGSGVEK